MRLFKREIDFGGMFIQPVKTDGSPMGARLYAGDDFKNFEKINGYVNNRDNPNYGLYENKPQRMAGEDLSQALTDDDVIDFLIEMEGPASATAALPDAYQMLMEKTNEYARLNRSLVEAGVRESDIDMYKELDTGILRGNVPGPYIKSRKGNETRVFMDRQQNDITGKPELVPFADPSTGTPLTQRFGMLPIDGKQTKANEIIQQTALKLAGLDATFNNTRSHHYSDHIARNADGSVQRIEGKIRDSTMPKTDNIPIEGVRLPNTSLKGKEMARSVRSKINNNQRGRDIITSTEELLKQGVLKPPGSMDQRLGKILRSDPSYMKDPKGIYDSLLVTGYSGALQRRPDFKSDKLAVAPDSVYMVDDLSLAKKYIEGGKGSLMVTPNGGHSKDGPERAFVQAVLPVSAKQDGRNIYRDMTTASPNVGQLLSNLEYIRKPER